MLGLRLMRRGGTAVSVLLVVLLVAALSVGADAQLGSRVSSSTALRATLAVALRGPEKVSAEKATQPVKDGPAQTTSVTWPTYLGSDARTGYNASETIINPQSVSSLSVAWTASAGGGTATQPIVANGLVYMGSWDGYERAVRPGGQVAWAFFVGTAAQTCEPYNVGVVASPTIATETVAGTSQSVLYIISVGGMVYALNALTGAELWHTQMAGFGSGWASPLVYGGSVYVETCGARGAANQLAQLNAGTGAIENQFLTSAFGSICSGPGIWGSPTVNDSTGVLFIATADAKPCNMTWNESVIAFQASDLSLIGSWEIPLAQESNDTDFGSTPTLFSADINGTTENMVGVGGKNGMFYALDQADLSAGPVWEERVAVEGNSPDFYGQGTISPAAFDGTNLYVAGGATTMGNVACSGSLRALNPANGDVVWQVCLPGPVIGAVTAVPGVVFVGGGNQFTAVSAATGQILWDEDLPGGQPIYGGATVVDGVLYEGSMAGSMYAYTPSTGASVFAAPPAPCASTVPVAVNGMSPGEQVNLYLDSTSSTPLATATAGSSGSAYTNVPITIGPAGPHTLIAVGQTSGATASEAFPTAARLCLSVYQGPQGTVESVSGAGFSAGDAVSLYYNAGIPPTSLLYASGGTLVAQVTAGSLGNFGTGSSIKPATFTIPSSVYAPQYVQAVGADGSLASAEFLVLPALHISQTSGPAGTNVTLSGVDFNPQWTVTATGDCAPVSCGTTTLGTAITNFNGVFSGLSATIPTDAYQGTYVITVTGTQGTSTTVNFTVTSSSNAAGPKYLRCVHGGRAACVL